MQHLSAGGRGDELDSVVSSDIREFRENAEEDALAEADSGNESEMNSFATKDLIHGISKRWAPGCVK